MMATFEEKWDNIKEMLSERFGKEPDMEAILFLIGINELDSMPGRKFSKEQKQDLMHIAVCSLLSQLGYYAFIGRDGDGWPHYEEMMPVPTGGVKEQEHILKECIIRYFEPQ